MTLDELIEKALAAKAKYGGLTDVMIRQDSEEYDFSLADFAGVKDIRFYDEEYDEEDAPDIPCFCITD